MRWFGYRPGVPLSLPHHRTRGAVGLAEALPSLSARLHVESVACACARAPPPPTHPPTHPHTHTHTHTTPPTPTHPPTPPTHPHTHPSPPTTPEQAPSQWLSTGWCAAPARRPWPRCRTPPRSCPVPPPSAAPSARQQIFSSTPCMAPWRKVRGRLRRLVLCRTLHARGLLVARGSCSAASALTLVVALGRPSTAAASSPAAPPLVRRGAAGGAPQQHPPAVHVGAHLPSRRLWRPHGGLAARGSRGVGPLAVAPRRIGRAGAAGSSGGHVPHPNVRLPASLHGRLGGLQGRTLGVVHPPSAAASGRRRRSVCSSRRHRRRCLGGCTSST